jgi:hypothetical protein
MLSCRQDFEQGLGHITVGSVSEWSMVQHSFLHNYLYKRLLCKYVITVAL